MSIILSDIIRDITDKHDGFYWSGNRQFLKRLASVTAAKSGRIEQHFY